MSNDAHPSRYNSATLSPSKAAILCSSEHIKQKTTMTTRAKTTGEDELMVLYA